MHPFSFFSWISNFQITHHPSIDALTPKLLLTRDTAFFSIKGPNFDFQKTGCILLKAVASLFQTAHWLSPKKKQPKINIRLLRPWPIVSIVRRFPDSLKHLVAFLALELNSGGSRQTGFLVEAVHCHEKGKTLSASPFVQTSSFRKRMSGSIAGFAQLLTFVPI